MASSSPPPDSAFEHGRRNQIRKYLQKFTTTIRRGSKDAVTDDSIPQSTTETHEHSHDDTLFDFSNIITADEPPTTVHGLEQSRPEQPQPIPSMTTTETFHIDRASVYQERAQKLRDRYGLNVAGSDRSTFPLTARRVQKSARMRVHRSCHMCGVEFGHGIHCRACHHRLCGDCPRAPGRRIQEAMAQAREFPFHVVDESSSSLDSPMAESLPEQSTSVPSPGEEVSKSSVSLGLLGHDKSLLSALEVDDDAFDFSPALLTRAARHGASTQFIPVLPRSSRHVPYSVRDPILKAPAGVQRVYRKPRQRVRYTCHECHTAFDKHVRVCAKCSHERCHDCRDVPSRKAQPDPKLVEAVNQRLAEVGK